MPVPAAALSPGTLVLGRYRPLRPLGSGGAGSVWLARDEPDGRDVALKIVSREGTLGPRAEREAAAVAQLRHERCLRVYALARDAEHVYIAYEYVRGHTLRHALRERTLGDRGLVEAAAQILDGLAHAHARGIVHRDVKPPNILLEDGPGLSVRILDFGLALVREEETLTAVGDIPGTLAYISPERLRGETAGPPADVWAVGVLLWEGLAGKHPFWGGTLIETANAIQRGAPSLAGERPDLPKRLVRLVDAALAADPRRRPSAARLAGDLRAVLASPRPAPARTRGARLRRRAPIAHIATGAAAVAFAAWTATALPFYPSGWWAGLAATAGCLAPWAPRTALALALAVPILPLGNYALGLALVYAVAAALWLAIGWREPRAGLFVVLGPLVGPLAALGFLPLAGQVVRSPVRRAAQVAGAVLAAAAVASLSHLDELRIRGESGALPVARALWRALVAHPDPPLEALALAAAAVLLPFCRGRGAWPAAGFGAGMLALTVLPTHGVPTLPLALAAWLTAAALAAEPLVRERH
jgi:eukaryotic-like serine/threonine-protein kinase